MGGTFFCRFLWRNGDHYPVVCCILWYDFPYRDLIIVNETAEEIKFEIPVFDGSYIEEYEKLGLKVIPVSEHDSYLNLYKKAHAELDALKAKLD